MIEYNATDWFYNDIERLRRYSPDWAESVYDLLDLSMVACPSHVTRTRWGMIVAVLRLYHCIASRGSEEP